MIPRNFPILSLTFLATLPDGTQEEQEITGEDLGSIKYLVGTDNEQSFWIASSHERLMHGTHVIASPVDGQPVPENYKDWTNTLIGIIRDGHGEIFLSYDGGIPGEVKTSGK